MLIEGGGAGRVLEHVPGARRARTRCLQPRLGAARGQRRHGGLADLAALPAVPRGPRAAGGGPAPPRVRPPVGRDQRAGVRHAQPGLRRRGPHAGHGGAGLLLRGLQPGQPAPVNLLSSALRRVTVPAFARTRDAGAGDVPAAFVRTVAPGPGGGPARVSVPVRARRRPAAPGLRGASGSGRHRRAGAARGVRPSCASWPTSPTTCWSALGRSRGLLPGPAGLGSAACWSPCRSALHVAGIRGVAVAHLVVGCASSSCRPSWVALRRAGLPLSTAARASAAPRPEPALTVVAVRRGGLRPAGRGRRPGRRRAQPNGGCSAGLGLPGDLAVHVPSRQAAGRSRRARSPRAEGWPRGEDPPPGPQRHCAPSQATGPGCSSTSPARAGTGTAAPTSTWRSS